MSKVLTLRVPDSTAERLKKIARRQGRSVSEIGARSLEEWLRQNEFADIEFRDFQGERHACMVRELQVWQVIMVARDYEFDPEKTAAYFGWPVSRAMSALNYYRAYPEEIDRALAENDSITFEDLQRTLPGIRLTIVNLDDDSGQQAE